MAVTRGNWPINFIILLGILLAHRHNSHGLFRFHASHSRQHVYDRVTVFLIYIVCQSYVWSRHETVWESSDGGRGRGPLGRRGPGKGHFAVLSRALAPGIPNRSFRRHGKGEKKEGIVMNWLVARHADASFGANTFPRGSCWKRVVAPLSGRFSQRVVRKKERKWNEKKKGGGKI